MNSNWWRDFSTWEDFHSLLNENLKLVQNSISSIELIDENGNILIIARARRKKLGRLKDISAYKVAGRISGISDMKKLQLPMFINRLVASVLNTYSRDL